jgi:hypothetical protein
MYTSLLPLETPWPAVSSSGEGLNLIAVACRVIWSGHEIN